MIPMTLNVKTKNKKIDEQIKISFFAVHDGIGCLVW